MQDLIAGQIDLATDAAVDLSLVRAGRIKAYAVLSDTRLAMAPDIPTVGEMGWPTLSAFSAWFGLFAPRGSPKEIIGKLNAAAREALADPAVRSRIVDFGMEIFACEPQTPEALGALQKVGAEKWWPIIEESGIKPE
jgi:tripartite-type tricarboxylate transporter receptor subunit TctC